MPSDQTTVKRAQYLVDYNALSTEPGGPGPFAPPPGWQGTEATYRKRIREALLQKRDRYQQLLALMHRENSGVACKKATFVGPYAEAAKEVYEDLKAESNSVAA